MTYQEVCDKLVKLETDLAAAHAVSAAKDTTIADLTAKLAAIPAPAATADQLDAIGAKIDQIDAGVAA